MIQRVYHGTITPDDVAQDLLAAFNRGNFVSQRLDKTEALTVQIATHRNKSAGGNTALTIQINQIEDGVSIQIGEQSWFGVAASLGSTIISTIRNPFNLINRLDDIAQDIESLQLTEDIWKVIDKTALAHQASFELSEKLKRLECRYCGAANPVGEPTCIACGAPLGNIQPTTCSSCGYVALKDENFCPNCGSKIT